MLSMATNGTLLCIHGQPSKLSTLQENGYELATATNISDGLKLLRSQPVDAVLVEYRLCLSENAAVADEIKRVRLELPIIMLVDHLKLPQDALRSVNALVAKSDGDHILGATVHFLVNVRPTQRRQIRPKQDRPRSVRENPPAIDEKDEPSSEIPIPFSFPAAWLQSPR